MSPVRHAKANRSLKTNSLRLRRRSSAVRLCLTVTDSFEFQEAMPPIDVRGVASHISRRDSYGKAQPYRTGWAAEPRRIHPKLGPQGSVAMRHQALVLSVMRW